MTSASVDVPLAVRVSFAHAALQHLAADCGADVLHIKGEAIDRSITTPGRSGADADVLVRPSHVLALLDAMRGRGWRVRTSFDAGSPFGHATTLVHALWGYADVHRLFPGITAPADEAFKQLWAARQAMTIAGVECPVPGLPAQVLIMVLNAARGGWHGPEDLETAWNTAEDPLRAEVAALVAALGAEVAFAAGTGDLERFRGTREYALWRVVSKGGTRFEEWAARVRAAPNRREALRLALRAPMVNTEHLAVRLRRPPSRWDVLREFLARPVRGVREQARSRRPRRARS